MFLVKVTFLKEGTDEDDLRIETYWSVLNVLM